MSEFLIYTNFNQLTIALSVFRLVLNDYQSLNRYMKNFDKIISDYNLELFNNVKVCSESICNLLNVDSDVDEDEGSCPSPRHFVCS